MTITALLAPRQILLDSEVSSKKKLLELVANLGAEITGLAESTIYASLLSRERLGSTGLGNGFAIPHARLESLQQTVGLFLRLATPINFEAPDGKPVDLVFSILIPEQATEEHLVILSSLAKIFSAAEICQQIREAGDSDAVTRIIARAEQ